MLRRRRNRQYSRHRDKENLVAFAGVDEARAANTFKANPTVPRFRGYQQLRSKLGNQVDAVTISTPDHIPPIPMAAMSLGKHVVVEKPMVHTVAETRLIAALARDKKAATQMGNQGPRRREHTAPP